MNKKNIMIFLAYLFIFINSGVHLIQPDKGIPDTSPHLDTQEKIELVQSYTEDEKNQYMKIYQLDILLIIPTYGLFLYLLGTLLKSKLYQMALFSMILSDVVESTLFNVSLDYEVLLKAAYASHIKWLSLLVMIAITIRYYWKKRSN